ncbi:MAG TPA: hypothetical protein VEK08_13220 [Planctomycetota bacterium]|nr:hypothetical protein [Planctomycetota bacterium]
MRVHPFIAALFLFGIAVGVSAAGPATQMSIASGNNQSVTVGTSVPTVVCVIVRDANGAAVSGVSVTWGLITGGGSITGETQITDTRGIATLGSWTLGTAAGTNTITAQSAGLNDVLFTATGLAGAATQMTALSGDNQSAPAGGPVPILPSVSVKDVHGNPVLDVAVEWGGISGGGSITGSSSKTNADGVAAPGSWTLGRTLGRNTLTASGAGLPSVTFTATAVAGAPAKLVVAAGNFQTAAVGTPVSDVVCAAVRDANNIGVQGVSVTFGDVTGGGSITGAEQVTDANGIVTLGSWTLGPVPGTNTISASTSGLTAITFTATGVAAATDANAVIKWNNALLQAVKNTKVSPPVSSRALAIVHTAMFDAWAAYDPVALGTQLGASLRRSEAERTVLNKQTAVGYAAYRTLVDLFPTQQILFDSLAASEALEPSNTSTDPSTPAGVGNAAAAALIAFRHSDGSNQLGDLSPGAYSDYTGYGSVNTPDELKDPNLWQPLRLANGQVQTFLVPHWGRVTPFAIGTGTTRQKMMPKPPARTPGNAYKKQAKEVLELSAALNDTTKTMAEYWADGAGTDTPPGHWFRIAQFVSQRDQHSLDEDVKLFFALGNAVFDAGIEVWDCKRHYDSVRPISAIRHLYKGQSVQAWAGPGQGTQTISGESWQSYIATPPFGEYVSGHSTFSAAAAQILRSFTRKDNFGFSVVVPAGSSLIEPGTPSQEVTFTWKRFTDAANDAGMSRRYGGIHFKDGDLQGRALGKKIGVLVWKKALQYIEGKVKP